MNEGISVADALALRNTGYNGGYGNGFGGDNGWWIIIFIILAFCGWGNGGFGGGFGGGSGVQGALTRGDLCMDMNFNDLQNGVRNVNDAVNLGFANLNSTICHQQYDTTMQTNAIQAAVNGGFSALNSSLCQQQYDTAMQLNGINNTIQGGFNATQAQLAQCCCDQKAGLADLKYTIASEDCATRNLIQNTTRDMIDTNNLNTRAILDKLTAQEIAAKDAQIAAQTQKIFGLELAASQAAQNSYLINQLRPFPVASYNVPNPFTGVYGYGYNNGCGCGCGCA